MAAGREGAGIAVAETVEVRPREAGFEVVSCRHRRGPRFASFEEAILHGEGLAPRVLVMSPTGKVERVVRSRGILEALLAEHLVSLGAPGAGHECRWQVAERWSGGERAGWFVEHDGGCCEIGEDGPHASRAQAESCMAWHLRVAIAVARGRR